MLKRRYHLIAALLAILAIALFGCGTNPGTADNSQKLPADSVENKEEFTEDVAPNIAGIHLGDLKADVTKILGNDYRETFNEEAGYYGEQQYVLEYKQGIKVLIGKDSLKVLDITAYSPDFTTNLGVKVGDSAGAVLAKYRAEYEEYQGIYSDGKNLGWFEVEDGVLMIFDFDKDNGTLANDDVQEDSQVEVVKLAYSRHFE